MGNLNRYVSAAGRGMLYLGKNLANVVLDLPVLIDSMRMNKDGAIRYSIARERRFDVEDPRLDEELSAYQN